MNQPAEFDLRQARRPSLPRRLAAIVYDAVVLAGLLLLTVGLIVIPLGLALGQAAWEELQHTAAMRWLLQAALLVVMVAFHVGFWTHGGQSLGMRAWRLQVVRWDGGPLRLSDALVRYALAWLSALPLGLGFAWSLWDPDGYTWHDRWSRTRLVMVKRDR